MDVILKRGIERISQGVRQVRAEQEKKHKKFKLAEHYDKLTFKALTNMPLAEKIDLLWQLDSSLGADINKCIQMIYSHITQRTPQEGYEHFFHATAATALYEAHYQTLIHGKDHAKKAAGIYNKVKNTISSIEQAITHGNISARQREILLDFKAILTVHKNALKIAIKAQTIETKAHLKTHCGLGKLSEPSLSLSSEARAQNMFPVGETAPSTPKRLSVFDKASIFSVTAQYSPQTRKARAMAKNRIIASRRALEFDIAPASAKAIIPNAKRKLMLPRSLRRKSAIASASKDKARVDTKLNLKPKIGLVGNFTRL